MIERISDPSDARLADYRELKDAAARRRIERNEFFIAEGPVAIERLVASGHRVRSILVSERKRDRMSTMLEALDAPVFVADGALLREIVGFDLHRGAIASADRRPPPSLADVLATTSRVAILEGLNDPENVGAVARSARAFGVEALILDPTCIDPYTRRTVRVSMGEILFLPTCRVVADRWPAVLDEVHEARFETWALTPVATAEDIWDLDPPERLGVLIGAEGAGLSTRVMRSASRRVRIPIDADVDSLNVGAAAAAAFAIVGREARKP